MSDVVQNKADTGAVVGRAGTWLGAKVRRLNPVKGRGRRAAAAAESSPARRDRNLSTVGDMGSPNGSMLGSPERGAPSPLALALNPDLP